MNKIINKFLLTGDKFMPAMHLRQPGFIYCACGPFTKHRERINKFMNTGDTRFIYKNDLDKACFQHVSAYSDSKDLVKRAQSDKILRDNAFNIAKNPKYDGYQRGLASMVYKFFDKKSFSPKDKSSRGSGINKENKGNSLQNSENVLQNSQLANKLHKPIIRKFKKRKVYSSFKDNIWGVDLADMQLTSKYNKGIKYILCAIDLFSKYAFVVPLNYNKLLIINAF